MAALLTFLALLATLLARALQQTLGDPCRERDPSSCRGGLHPPEDFVDEETVVE